MAVREGWLRSALLVHSSSDILVLDPVCTSLQPPELIAKQKVSPIEGVIDGAADEVRISGRLSGGLVVCGWGSIFDRIHVRLLQHLINLGLGHICLALVKHIESPGECNV